MTTVVVVDDDSGDDALFREALRTPRARTVVRRYNAGAVDTTGLPPELAAMLTGLAPRAYVCAGSTCAAPTDNVGELRITLETLRG